MRWFKHDCDMHTDLKVQILIKKHGVEGYGIYNLCLEMVGQQGKKGKIEGQLRWREAILKMAGWSDNGKLDKIINTMAEVRLICPKSLKYGNLSIPKFIKRADDYTTRKLRTLSEQDTDNVRVDKKRIEKIREEYIKAKGFRLTDFSSDDFARTGKAIKTLINKAGGEDTQVIEAIKWASKQSWCDWTLETVIRRWLSFKSQSTQPTFKKP